MTKLRLTSACILFVVVLTCAPAWFGGLLNRSNHAAAQGQPVPATIIRTIVYRQVSNFPNNLAVLRLKLSADGSKIVFSAYDPASNSAKVFTTNADGTGFTQLYDFRSNTSTFIDISANGARVIWADGNSGQGAIFVANSDGSNQQSIATAIPGSGGSTGGLALSGYSPRLTADGSRVIFYAASDTYETSGVFVIDANGANLRRLFSYRQVADLVGLSTTMLDNCGAAGRSTGNLDISDNGARLLIGVGCLGAGGAIVTFDGTTLRTLVSATGRVAGDGDQRLAISGDGGKILLARRVGNEERTVFVLNFDGSGQTKLLAPFGVNGLSIGGLTTNGAQALVSTESHSLPLLNTNGSGRVDLLIRADCDSEYPLFGGDNRGASSLAANGRRFAFRTAVPGAPQQLWVADINPATTGDAPRINEVEFNPSYVTTSGTTFSTFTARATDAQGAQSGLRRRICSNALRNGEYESRLLTGGVPFGIALFDDGTNGGDSAANDGLFTQTRVVRNLAPPDPTTALQIRHHAMATSLRQITAVDAVPFFVLAQAPGGAGPMITSITPSSGAAGIQVKLTGSNFDPVAANNIVLFGNRQASVVSATADGTMLEVIVPPDLPAGTVAVTVTVKAQTSNAVNFNVTGTTPTPTPTPGGVTVTDHRMTAGPIPSGCAPPILKTNFTPTDALAFQWTSVSGSQTGALIRWDWIQPNGSIFKQFQATLNNTNPNVCFWDAIDIAGQPAASLPGNW